MPGTMDGLMLAQAVHNRWPSIKIILVSGQVKPTDDDKPEESRFFGKPIDVKEMISELQNMIGAGALKVIPEAAIPLAVELNYDKQIWSGLSWGAGEIRNKDFASGRPITIRCSSSEKDPVLLEGHVYVVEY